MLDIFRIRSKQKENKCHARLEAFVNNPNIRVISIAMDERDFVVLYEANSGLRK
jgi:hypothetical protein